MSEAGRRADGTPALYFWVEEKLPIAIEELHPHGIDIGPLIDSGAYGQVFEAKSILDPKRKIIVKLTRGDDEVLGIDAILRMREAGHTLWSFPSYVMPPVSLGRVKWPQLKNPEIFAIVRENVRPLERGEEKRLDATDDAFSRYVREKRPARRKKEALRDYVDSLSEIDFPVLMGHDLSLLLESEGLIFGDILLANIGVTADGRDVAYDFYATKVGRK